MIYQIAQLPAHRETIETFGRALPESLRLLSRAEG